MARPKSNPLANRLALRLAELSQPLYVVAPTGQIEFVNRGLADWVGLREAELVGCDCHYHSKPTPSRAAEIAAALCPPPEAFAGAPMESTIHLSSADAQPIAGHVRFVPLGFPAEEQSVAVLGILNLDASAVSPQHVTSEAARLHSELQALRVRQFPKERATRLFGTSPVSRRTQQQLELAIQSPANVLLVGLPGAQARLIAREIHAAGASAGKLIPIDAPRMDAESIRDLLSPWQTFPDRHSTTPPTLLCFEVDQLSPEAQLELETQLREAPGGIRAISTAACSVEQLAHEQKFRLELACRLSTITIELPPLSARLGDLPLVAQALVEDLNSLGARQLGGFAAEALDQLSEHTWPGDVDELTQVVREAFENARGPLIATSDLPTRFLAQLRSKSGEPRRAPSLDLESFLGELETELLQRALTLAKGNKTKAAKMLGMTRPRLYRRLVQRGLEQPDPAETLDEIDWSEEMADESSPGEANN